MADKVIVKVEAEIKDLIPNFLANRRKDIAALERALVTRDYRSCQDIGHNMKGVGGGYGFDDITTIGIRLEAAAKNNNDEEIAACLAFVRDYLERVEIVYV